MRSRTLALVRALVLADRDPQPGEVAELGTDVDCVFLLGDLSAWRLAGLRELPVPKFGVYGNHCGGEYFSSFGVQNVHRRALAWNGLRIAGLSGCVRYKPFGDFQYEQSDVEHWLAPLKEQGPDIDVFLTHTPPAGVNDQPEDGVHGGWTALRDYVLARRPRVLFHGHTHPRGPLQTHLGDTRIVYVHGAEVVEF